MIATVARMAARAMTIGVAMATAGVARQIPPSVTKEDGQRRRQRVVMTPGSRPSADESPETLRAQQNLSLSELAKHVYPSSPEQHLSQAPLDATLQSPAHDGAFREQQNLPVKTLALHWRPAENGQHRSHCSRETILQSAVQSSTDHAAPPVPNLTSPQVTF
jgi:hypothetical protein